MFTFASAFSGIAGLDHGFHNRGQCTLMVEIAEHPRTVLARHYPGVPMKEDIRDVQPADLAGATAFVFGFPCKDTSIAARNREGLHGNRSGLFFEALRLIEGARPEWVILENPDGVLTSNQGRDWLTVTDSLGRLGYGWAYRVVDAHEGDGSPQKRTRVILVAHRSGDSQLCFDLLHDPGAGSEVPAPAALTQAGEGRPDTAGDGGGTSGAGVLIWRKSARPRASIAEGGYETWVPVADDEAGNTLTGFDFGGPLRQTHLIAQDGRLRTATVTEWERLSGFEDGWTEGIPERDRATALGNCVHAGTGEWAAGRVVPAHEALHAFDQESTA